MLQAIIDVPVIGRLAFDALMLVMGALCDAWPVLEPVFEALFS